MVKPNAIFPEPDELAPSPSVTPDMSDNYKGGFNERAISDQSVEEKEVIVRGIAKARQAILEAREATEHPKSH